MEAKRQRVPSFLLAGLVPSKEVVPWLPCLLGLRRLGCHPVMHRTLVESWLGSVEEMCDDDAQAP